MYLDDDDDCDDCTGDGVALGAILSVLFWLAMLVFWLIIVGAYSRWQGVKNVAQWDVVGIHSAWHIG